LGDRDTKSRCEEEPSRGDSAVITWNPMAGRRSSLGLAEELKQLLSRGGMKVYFFNDIWQAASAAGQLFSEKTLRAFVAVGGDGTFSLQVNLTSPGMPLALLPAGTGNVLAKSLGLPRSPRRLAEAILAGKKAQLDAGEANGKIFVNMISLGFDALVVAKVHEARTRNVKAGHIGYWNYFRPIVQSCREYSFPELKVLVNPSVLPPCSEASGGNLEPGELRGPTEGGRRLTGGASPTSQCPGSPGSSKAEGSGEGIFTSRWVFVCNTPRYGWGVRIAPRANPWDGRLDCWMFRRGSIISGLGYALAVQLGGLHRLLPDCQHLQATRFLITSTVPVPWQLDGDPAGFSPVEVKVLPGRITLFVP
jgi:diacylglycerol kinase (ATP)